MRCRAYQLPSDAYREIEGQILEQVRHGERQTLLYLLGEHDLEIELLSGEWRLLLEQTHDFYQFLDPDRRLVRMVVSPDELAEFVDILRNPGIVERWRPVSFGLAELIDALPAACDLVGVVFVEESDDWLWSEPVHEIVAIRPDVFALLEGPMRKLMDQGDWASLARLAGDHCEGSVEFSKAQWKLLLDHARERTPEILSVFEAHISNPSDYTHVREALTLVADPEFQPSLEAWLRVHAAAAQYALFFRNAALERSGVQEDDVTASAADSITARIAAP